MTTSKIKDKLNNYIGKEVLIKCDLGRNKYEEYNAVIDNLYNHVFTVKLYDNYIKSFSYIDVITKTVKIEF